MPGQRKRTVLGRAPGQDRAGHTLASLEHIEHWCDRATKAGLDINLWYREGIERLHILATRPITRADIDEMGEIQEAMELGFQEASIPADGLIPDKYRLHDLQWRTWQHRKNLLVDWPV